MVRIVIGNVTSKIVGHLPSSVQTELYDTLSYKVLGAKYIPKVRDHQWDGYIRLYKQYGQSFYTGLLGFVRDILDKQGVPYDKLDRRIRPEPNMPDLVFAPTFDYEERPYQAYTVERSKKFTRSVLEVCTGGGKTVMVTKLISEIKTAPFMFYVLTKDLMKQAHDTLSSCLNTKIGMIGDGKCDIHKINVCTIQTAVRALHQKNKKFDISNYKFDDEDVWNEKQIESAEKADRIRKLVELTKGLYLDECHHVASSVCREILTASTNAYWRYGGSATPYREDNADILIQSMFGSKSVKINASYLIKKKYLLRPYIFFEPIDYCAHYSSFSRIYKEVVAQNVDYNSHIACTANHLVNRELSTLILVKQYVHGNILKKMIPGSEFVTGKMSTSKRSKCIEDMRNKKLRCMIATTLADEGLDIPTLDVALLAGLGASSSRVTQRIGRTLRPDRHSKSPRDKSVVVVYDHHRIKYLSKHVKKVKKMLKTEDEFVIRQSRGMEHIRNEIDEVFGFETNSSPLFGE